MMVRMAKIQSQKHTWSPEGRAKRSFVSACIYYYYTLLILSVLYILLVHYNLEEKKPIRG